MDTEKFLKAYSEPRNGCNGFIRHGLVRRFAFSDGVQDCAEAGAYWILDIAATELPAVIRSSGESLATFTVKVKGGKAEMTLEGSGDVPLPWKRNIDYTDMPEGEWVFLIADEAEGDTPFRMILISEY